MIISTPNKFFVPVITLKNYKEILDIGRINESFNESLLRNGNDLGLENISRRFLEDKIIDYKDNYDINEFQNVSRKFLEDKMPSGKDIETEVYEDISNIGDEAIEYYILKYVTAFMVYEKELEVQGCDINREEFLKQIQLYVQDLKNLYNEFMELKKKIKVPLSAEDQKGIEDYFVKKVKEIYSKQFANINCKAKEEVVDNNIAGIIAETREIIKKEIKRINQEILDKEKNHIIKDETYFKNLKEIYDEIDKES